MCINYQHKKCQIYHICNNLIVKSNFKCINSNLLKLGGNIFRERSCNLADCTGI